MIAQFRCPQCGTALHVSSVADAGAPAGFQTHTMQSFNFGGAAPNLEQVHERVTPMREPTIPGDVKVPLAQATITAAVIAASSSNLKYSSVFPSAIPYLLDSLASTISRIPIPATASKMRLPFEAVAELSPLS